MLGSAGGGGLRGREQERAPADLTTDATGSNNFSARVDARRELQRPSGIGRNQIGESDRIPGPVVVVEQGARITFRARVRRPYDEIAADRHRRSIVTGSEGAEICDAVGRPQHGVVEAEAPARGGPASD